MSLVLGQVLHSVTAWNVLGNVLGAWHTPCLFPSDLPRWGPLPARGRDAAAPQPIPGQLLWGVLQATGQAVWRDLGGGGGERRRGLALPALLLHHHTTPRPTSTSRKPVATPCPPNPVPPFILLCSFLSPCPSSDCPLQQQAANYTNVRPPLFPSLSISLSLSL